MVDLVRGNPLAQLVTNGAPDEGPYATHVPIILDPHLPGEVPADLAGITLWGHMNRANPHWKALRTGAQVVATFTGPHAYVSPTVYRTAPAAPTWNFTAVHVRGVLRTVEPGDETLETVMATVQAFEADFGAGWSMAGSVDYFRKIVRAVGAFRIAVTSCDGMFKLSQEQPPDVRQRVRSDFARRESSHHKEIAQLMNRLPGKGADRDGAQSAS